MSADAERLDEPWPTDSATVIEILYARTGRLCETAKLMTSKGGKLPRSLAERCKAARAKYLLEHGGAP